MQKIMFNDKYGLTQAVLEGRKTMTRREIKCPKKSHPRKDVPDLTGRKFGNLTVLSRHHIGYDRKWYYECLCECGNISIVRSNALISGNTQSCGCKKGHRDSHHKSKTRLYRIWIGMRDRCLNKNNKAYERYGGRSIIVCEDWKNSFLEFEKWALTHGYSENLSLDRINVNGNYSPNNCRWASPQEQADNKRNNILITINCETHNLQQWCDIYNINRSTVNTRVRMCGWDYKKAITTPTRIHKQYKQRSKNNYEQIQS